MLPCCLTLSLGGVNRSLFFIARNMESQPQYSVPFSPASEANVSTSTREGLTKYIPLI